MSNQKLVTLSLLVLCCVYVYSEDGASSNETELVIMKSINEAELDIETHRERLLNQSKDFEKGLKNLIKGAVKNLLPTLMSYNSGSSMSTKCMSSLVKYISGLTSVKVWAMRMLDATSKPPSGIFEGTLSDFGGFDTCLEVVLPSRNGKIEFQGQYCAIEAKPVLPPVPKNFSMAKQTYAKPLDTVGKEIIIAGMAFHYLKFRLGICIPSTCSLQDMQAVAKQIGSRIDMDVQIPQCYTKEPVIFRPVHVAVIFLLSLLLAACIAGSVIEYRSMKIPDENKQRGRRLEVLKCFSFISNYNRLISPSQGSAELKALHGLRALSIAWVILGHTYVWINFQLLRRPKQIVTWFNSIDFGLILNGWLGVEPFFLLSGLLTSYTAMKMLPKTKGRINIPVYILRRYIRLTPPLLLSIGLLFFLPLISSGPFWYERVDPEIKSCTNYWWRSILYISNWFGMKNICVHPTWYLSADFQLHVITVIILLITYRSPKLGLSLIASIVLACSVMVAVLTYLWDLPPIILISSGNNERIEQTLDVVHMNTFTHAGPYYVGIITGYLILKYKEINLSKVAVACGWILSAFVSLASVYGAHRWNIGESHGPLLTVIYAALHRTTFSIGVAWVIFACVTGYGGLVNRFLSSSMLTPVSRLSFMIYLLHSLIIWTRMGSLRERMFYSHYNVLYEYMGNLVLSVLFTVPFYLLLEAPVSNLERLVFSPSRADKDDDPKQNGHLQSNITTSNRIQHLEKVTEMENEDTVVPVELKSVKHLENGCNNLAFNHV